MLETTEKTKDKEDIDYVINQLKELKTRYGYTLFDDAFTRKLKIKLGRIGTFSDSALLFLQILKYDSFALSTSLFDSLNGSLQIVLFGV